MKIYLSGCFSFFVVDHLVLGVDDFHVNVEKAAFSNLKSILTCGQQRIFQRWVFLSTHLLS